MVIEHLLCTRQRAYSSTGVISVQSHNKHVIPIYK